MKITAIETIQLGEMPNLLILRVHTDEGLAGLGETYFTPTEVAAYLHTSAAPLLLGEDPARIDGLRLKLQRYIGTRDTGVESRGNSAVDIALWDLFGKATGRPIHDLLGGATRPSIRAYNTCAGYRYTNSTTNITGSKAWGLPEQAQPARPYEDLQTWLSGRADELAHSLLEQGITGMKMWPFDDAAGASNGYELSTADLNRALEPFRTVRKAVGDAMDLMVELHGLWSLPMALKIAHAFEAEGLNPYWIEDPLRPEDMASLAAFAHGTRLRTTASELLSGRLQFRELLEARACGVVMLDLGWCGGISEGKAIASLAEAFGLPIAPHDCTGPIVWAASCHLSLNAPNALIQETVRAFYTDWYRELVTGLPIVENGTVRPSPGPGLGVELLPDLANRPDATVRRSAL
ncbi:MAG: mandelate racemase/muconate lactonizing enzyme family protein [Chloroflexi bacterium]|nr:mandelate racemase/muconate lactonizing enzyme family protein [Chloroflexota bacterium]